MSDTLKYVAIADISENQAALRAADRESKEFMELVESVRSKGVLTPISVRVNNQPGGLPYVLVDGLQRFTAAGEAGLTEIPAKISDNMTDEDALEAQIVANVQRIDTKPVEYTRALQRLLAMRPLLTKKALATSLGKTEGWLSERLGLANLAEAVGAAVDNGQINLSNAYALAKLPPEEQVNLIEQAISLQPSEFMPMAAKVRDEIKAAKREGRAPSTDQFMPTQHLRKLTEIREELEQPKAAPEILKVVSLDGLTSKEQVFLAGFKAAINWTLHADDISVAQAKELWEQKKREQAAKRESAKNDRLEAKKLKATIDAERISLEHELTVVQKLPKEEVAAKLAEFDAKHAAPKS